VSVCPTECRIFGDLDDPASEVARISKREAFMVRKPEKGTGPKILYLGAEDSVIRPEAAVRPLYYKEGSVHLRPLGAPLPEQGSPGDPRVDYDIPHGKPWGTDMVLYLLFKAIATGSMLVAALLWFLGHRGQITTIAAPLLSLVFMTATAAVLVLDLERPERFYYILTRSNWRSWMVWGAYFLTGHGLISLAWLIAGWSSQDAVIGAMLIPTAAVAVMATSYTGFLFAQGLGRDLWQGPAAAIDLVAQSLAAGSATLLVAALVIGAGAADTLPVLGSVLTIGVAAHLVILAFEHLLSPSPTRHHELATQTFRSGAYARLFWGAVVITGGLVPLAILLTVGATFHPLVTAVTAILALGGGAAWEYVWVEAGQSVPLS
jgi:formate-dependent nitrite reductase membrane component NrfD